MSEQLDLNDTWGGITRDTTVGKHLHVQMPAGLDDWLRAAGGAHGQASVVRLALLGYLAAEFPELRPAVSHG